MILEIDSPYDGRVDRVHGTIPRRLVHTMAWGVAADGRRDYLFQASAGVMQQRPRYRRFFGDQALGLGFSTIGNGRSTRGKALTFTGGGQACVGPAAVFSGLAEGSAAMLVSVPTTAVDVPLVSNAGIDVAEYANRSLIWEVRSNGRMRFRKTDTAGTEETLQSPLSTFPFDRWVAVGISWGPSNEFVYIDGAVANNQAVTTDMRACANDLLLAACFDGAVSYYGKLSFRYLAVWHRQLSHRDFEELHRCANWLH